MTGGHVDVEHWFESSLLLPRLLGGYPWGKVYSVFLLVLQAMNVFVYSSVAIQLQRNYYPNSFLGNYVAHALFYSLEIFSIICVFSNCIFKEAVGRYLGGLKTVEISLRALGLAAEYNTVKYIGLDWALATVIVCNVLLRSFVYENPFMGFYPTYLGFDISLLIVHGHLCVFTLLVGALKEQLDRLVHGMCTKTVSRVECLAEQAEVLCSLAVSIQSAFTLFTTLALSFYFMCTVVSVYYFWICLELSSGISIFNTFINVALCQFLIFRAVTSSVAVKNKSKEFNEALYTSLIRDTSRELIKSNKLRLYIAMSRKLNFTACGLFNIDFKLIHAVSILVNLMVATVVSYVIIIKQLENKK